MKKPIYITLAFTLFLSVAYLSFNNRCVAFGYDNVVISKELLCAKVTTSEEFQYEASTYTPLKELESDAEKYVPIPPPVPTLKTNNT